MASGSESSSETTGEVKAVRRRILALAGIVESVFADAVLAMADADSSVVRDVRREDYRAHKVWLDTDSLCVELLEKGQLEAGQARYIAAAIRIAVDLKQMADKAMCIPRYMKACPEDGIPSGPWTDVLSRMAEIGEGMLSSSLECLANRDAAGARALHLVSRESSSLNSQLIQQVNHGLASGRLQPQVGTALVLAGNALEQISQYALDVANQVRRLYAGEEPPGEPQEEAAP